MRKLRLLISGLILVAFAFVLVSPAKAAEKLKVLIVDGQNNHNWKSTTPLMKSFLEKTGRFSVAVATTPPKNSSEEV